MLREVFESGRPLTYVRSAEEQRVGSVLREVGLRLLRFTPMPVWTWSLTEGMWSDDEGFKPGTNDPRAALDFIVEHEEPGIFHLKDFHEALRTSPEIRRRFRPL